MGLQQQVRTTRKSAMQQCSNAPLLPVPSHATTPSITRCPSRLPFLNGPCRTSLRRPLIYPGKGKELGSHCCTHGAITTDGYVPKPGIPRPLPTQTITAQPFKSARSGRPTLSIMSGCTPARRAENSISPWHYLAVAACTSPRPKLAKDTLDTLHRIRYLRSIPRFNQKL